MITGLVTLLFLTNAILTVLLINPTKIVPLALFSVYRGWAAPGHISWQFQASLQVYLFQN